MKVQKSKPLLYPLMQNSIPNLNFATFLSTRHLKICSFTKSAGNLGKNILKKSCTILKILDVAEIEKIV
jgi:hypothetical protein